jgi:hypothetical chaperone protein
MLNQARYRSRISDCIAAGGAAARAFERLDELISRNHSYVVFQAIQAAKARLSSVDRTLIDIPELDLAIPVHRAQLDALLRPLMGRIRVLLTQMLEQAGVPPEDVSLVIRTGGSSLLAAVRSLLEDCFPGRVTEHDPFTSVAAGLAIASFQGLRHDLDAVPSARARTGAWR